MLRRLNVRDRRRIASGLAVALVLGVTMAACQRRAPLKFSVVVPKARRAAAVDGRLLLLLSTNPKGEPRLDMREPRQQISADKNAKQTFQLFGVDVDGLAPDTKTIIDDGALGFPAESLAQVPPGDYTVQAVLNVYETYRRKDGHTVKLPADHWEGQVWRTKPGNLYSEPRRMRIDPASSGTVAISLDKEIPALPYPKDTKYLKYVRIESALLTAFWGRKTELGAWVLVPEGYDEHPTAHYPLVVNPAHFSAEFQASQAKFAQEAADPKLKGPDAMAAEYNHKFYEEWTAGKLPRMLVMNIQHANQYYDDSVRGEFRKHRSVRRRHHEGAHSLRRENIPRHRPTVVAHADRLLDRRLGSARHAGVLSRFLQRHLGRRAQPDRSAGLSTGEHLRRQERVLVRGAVRPRPTALRRQPRHERHPSVRPDRRRPRGDHDGAGQPRRARRRDPRARRRPVGRDAGRVLAGWSRRLSEADLGQADGHHRPRGGRPTGAITTTSATSCAATGPPSGQNWSARFTSPSAHPISGISQMPSGTSTRSSRAPRTRRTEGSVEYGTRFIHCYQGDPNAPLAASSRTAIQRQMPVMAARMLKTAPAGADVKSWRY